MRFLIALVLCSFGVAHAASQLVGQTYLTAKAAATARGETLFRQNKTSKPFMSDQKAFSTRKVARNSSLKTGTVKFNVTATFAGGQDGKYRVPVSVTKKNGGYRAVKTSSSTVTMLSAGN